MNEALALIPAGVGVLLLIPDVFGGRAEESRRAIRAALSRPGHQVLESALGGVSAALAKKIRLDEYAREKTASELSAAGFAMTPERYVAEAVTKAALASVCTLPLAFVSPSLLLLSAAVFPIFYLKERGRAGKLSVAARREIEEELPRFVDTLKRGFSHSHDVEAVLEEYRSVAGKALAAELAITLADLRSGRVETALSRLEIRVGSERLGEVCRGLISTAQGDDVSFYWEQLSGSLKERSRQERRARAQVLPRKLNRLSMTVMFCFLLLYLVVIFYETVQSLAVLFG